MKPNPTTPYEIAATKFTTLQPGRARSIFLTWEAISEYLDFDYEKEMAELGVDDNYFINAAFIKTQQYTQGLVDEFSEEEEILEIENNYLKLIKEHWSLSNIISTHFNLKLLTEELNAWSKAGAKKPHLFGTTPNKGFCISYFLNPSGVSLTIYESFIIPYTEIFYEANDVLPEWNFEDIMPTDLLDTFFSLETLNGRATMIDLTDWHEKV